MAKKTMGEIISTLRREKGMTQKELADRLDIGGILCLVAYVGILALTILWQKQELMENIAQLKSKK